MPLNSGLVRWLASHELSHACLGELRSWNDTVGKLVGSYGWTSVSPDTRGGYALKYDWKMKRNHDFSSSDSELDENIEVEKESADENA